MRRRCIRRSVITVPRRSDEERAFAAAIRATLSANDINNSLNNIAGTSGEEGKTFARRHRDTLLIDEVAPGGHG